MRSRVLATALCCAVCATPAAAITIGDATFNQTIPLDIGVNTISDTTSAECFSAGGAEFCFDVADSAFSVEVAASTEITALRIIAGATTGTRNGNGSVNFTGEPTGLSSFSFSTGPSGTSLPLDILNFSEVGDPMGPLGPGIYALTAAQTLGVAESGTTDIVTSYTLEITVGVVPGPATAPLLLSALAAVALWRRKRRPAEA